jgi:hypothetical protein
MTPLRKTSLVAGVLYLLTFVSIPTLGLYGSVHDHNYIVGLARTVPSSSAAFWR